MKINVKAVVLCASVLAFQCWAQEDDGASGFKSNVIHDYTQFSLGYSYLDDVAGSGINFNGGYLGFSVQPDGAGEFLMDFSLAYGVGDDDLGIGLETDVFAVGGGVGWVFRMMDNRVNIIPRLSAGHSTLKGSAQGINASVNTTFLSPNVTLSIALTDWWSVYGGYVPAWNLDTNVKIIGLNVSVNDDDFVHGFVVGSDFALAENVGVEASVSFVEDTGFAGFTIGLGYHF